MCSGVDGALGPSSIRQPIFDDTTANEQSRKGISEIEGKFAEGSDERARDTKRVSSVRESSRRL
jgi:hypothetical protein